MDRVAPSQAFVRFAWAFFVVLLGVIVFGAWVRITHSGAGCGSHWPTCNGEVVPLDPSAETVIEYTHRLTSGLLGIAALGLVGWSLARYGIAHRISRAAIVTLGFVVLEALVGAGLVLQELVVDNDSVSRAVVVAIHLVNTLALTAAASLTAWWADDLREVRPRGSGSGWWWPLVALAVLLVTSMSGAVTALGDTLFPVDPTVQTGVIERVRSDLAPASHFLVRLRFLHPIVAVVAAAIVMTIAAWVRARAFSPLTRRLARVLRDLTGAQVLIGLVNIGLAAPGWLQLLHLVVGEAVWVAAVLTTVSVWSEATAERAWQPTREPSA